MAPVPKGSLEYAEWVRKQRDSHLGKKASPETKIILGKRLKERNDPRMGFKEGHIPWNKAIFDNPKYWINRFNSKYFININTSCWEWKAQVDKKTGYAKFWKNNQSLMAHRFSYEFFIGPIPSNLTVDHLCHNRKCVNPFHLDLITRHENARRSNNIIANNSAKTHCPQGHEYNTKNNYITKEGFRHCKECSKRKAIIRNVLKLISRRIHKEDILNWL